MMTQQLPAGILAAPLAEIDRRGLSQAWYSALHLARANANANDPTPSAPSSAQARTAKPKMRNSSQPRESRRTTALALRDLPGSSTVAFLAERRSTTSPLARHIERLVLDPRPNVKRTTFALEHDGARVQIMVQTKGAHSRLIVVCRSAQRAVVARALRQARLALASRGIRSAMLLWEVSRCS
ncbi:MAG: hypothetical protein JOY69_07525 [Candidatus Eremiobacteraeota bacterium]|nr:hypothetical protein [Candidatus Eremiobacteraeota bacterium]